MNDYPKDPKQIGFHQAAGGANQPLQTDGLDEKQALENFKSMAEAGKLPSQLLEQRAKAIMESAEIELGFIRIEKRGTSLYDVLVHNKLTRGATEAEIIMWRLLLGKMNTIEALREAAVSREVLIQELEQKNKKLEERNRRVLGHCS